MRQEDSSGLSACARDKHHTVCSIVFSIRQQAACKLCIDPGRFANSLQELIAGILLPTGLLHANIVKILSPFPSFAGLRADAGCALLDGATDIVGERRRQARPASCLGMLKTSRPHQALRASALAGSACVQRSAAQLQRSSEKCCGCRAYHQVEAAVARDHAF